MAESSPPSLLTIVSEISVMGGGVLSSFRDDQSRSRKRSKRDKKDKIFPCPSSATLRNPQII